MGAAWGKLWCILYALFSPPPPTGQNGCVPCPEERPQSQGRPSKQRAQKLVAAENLRTTESGGRLRISSWLFFFLARNFSRGFLVAVAKRTRRSLIMYRTYVQCAKSKNLVLTRGPVHSACLLADYAQLRRYQNCYVDHFKAECSCSSPTPKKCTDPPFSEPPTVQPAWLFAASDPPPRSIYLHSFGACTQKNRKEPSFRGEGERERAERERAVDGGGK